MLFRSKKDYTNFTEWRAWYCRVMITMMRDKLHYKIFFTFCLIAACVAFIYVQNEKDEQPYRYQDESGGNDILNSSTPMEDLPGELK